MGGSDASSPGPAEELELSRVQFIQERFSPFLEDASPSRIRWIHDRLFRDGWSIDTVYQTLGRELRRTRVIAITSGKGGVGKTTSTVHLAIALARSDRRVLVFDADLGLANTHVFAGVNPRKSLLDVIDGRSTLAETITGGPCGVQFICGASGVSRLADLDSRVLESVGRQVLSAATDFDVLVIDTGAGIGPAALHFLGLAHDVIAVTTPNIAATLDAYGVIKCLHERGVVANLHLLVNLADNPEEGDAAFTRIGGCAQQFLQRQVTSLGTLLRDREVEAANQRRAPQSLHEFGHPHASLFASIAARFSRHPSAVGHPTARNPLSPMPPP